MPLQISGPISLQEIQGEFGGSPPISLSEYYDAAAGIPSNGAIALSDFYGASGEIEVIISTNQLDLDLLTYATSNGWNGSSPLLVTINSGVVISSSDTLNYALTISGSFPSGVTVVNNGVIVGDGGNGGSGGGGSGEGGFSGQTGGPALNVSTPVSFDNQNTIAGGGGGGGGSGSSDKAPGAGGGGGQSGLVSSSGGDSGEDPGEDGTFSAPGAGGDGLSAGTGGDGGSWGLSGQSGQDVSESLGGEGGAGGNAVVGNSNITWINTGTRLGGIT